MQTIPVGWCHCLSGRCHCLSGGNILILKPASYAELGNKCFYLEMKNDSPSYPNNHSYLSNHSNHITRCNPNNLSNPINPIYPSNPINSILVTKSNLIIVVISLTKLSS